MKVVLSSFLLLFFYHSLVLADVTELESIESAELPNMADISNVQQKKETFFGFLDPIVSTLNERVALERAWLKVIQARIEQEQELAFWQQTLMEQLGAYYKVDDAVGSDSYFKTLFSRVDLIPSSLVLAQAANESAWGTSRFAVQGNNLFGQWCFSEGCGIVPSGRDSRDSHEVRSFASVAQSVEGYFRNINTHDQYRELRNIRNELRYLRVPLDSLYLVWGLEGYSIRGEHYIEELIEMIKFNRLKQFDQPAYYAKHGIRVALQE